MNRKRSFQEKMDFTTRFNRCKTPSGAVPISVIMGFDYPLEDRGRSGRGEGGLSEFTVQSFSNGNSDYSSNKIQNSLNSYRSGRDQETRSSRNLYGSSGIENTRSSLERYGSSLSRNNLENNSRSLYGSSGVENTRSSVERYGSSFENSSRNRYQTYQYPSQTEPIGKTRLASWREGSTWPSTLTRGDTEQNMNGFESRLTRAQTQARETLNSSRERYIRTSDYREHPKQQPCRYPTALSTYSTTTATPLSRHIRAQTEIPNIVSSWRQTGYFRSDRRTPFSSSRSYFSSVRSRFL